MSKSPGRVGIGVVGAGSIGIRGALEHLTLPDVQDRVYVAAVCDPVPGRAAAAAQKYGVKGAYETLQALLEDDTVDAVTMCSPINLHYEQGLAAIEAGKHIHFNKTMTVTSAEALDLIDKAKKASVHLVASPGQMIRSVNQHIRKMIAKGELGQFAWAVTGASFGSYHEQESVRSGTDVLSNINPAWYWRKPGGGPLYDMTVYGLHTLTGILGPAKRVTGMSANVVKEREFKGEMYPCDAEDTTLMVLDFGGNRFAFVHGTLAGSVSDFGQPSFYGTNGSITGTKFNGEPIAYPGKDEINFFGPHVTGPHVGKEEAHVFEDKMQLVDLILEGKPTVATAEHAAHVIEIIEAGLKSSDEGKTVDLKTTFEPIPV
ncbi:MAG TPA: Gfo/Idh/MocA family oxidoreductase [Fimbriimonas sp.]|nr:Gfo/Idh/MocA family oxidoreductase [Fimbriimonas sp.]